MKLPGLMIKLKVGAFLAWIYIFSLRNVTNAESFPTFVLSWNQTEAATGSILIKKVFLKISQNFF